ncbi:hypothetical protein AX334_24730 [Salmonella enterica]|nr:hypothetical protein [Salmonella enterica]EAY8676622.1 hypothetical protein [Salmonella enterica]EBB7877353.1 hypothetical protein [Salmonella enterica]
MAVDKKKSVLPGNSKPSTPDEKEKALAAAMGQIEKAFGKGSIMRLGDGSGMTVETISSGSLSLDIALGGAWSLTGQSGTLTDSAASTSPKIMLEGWEKLVQWINSHRHSNGNDGQDTGGPTSQFNGSITE